MLGLYLSVSSDLLKTQVDIRMETSLCLRGSRLDTLKAETDHDPFLRFTDDCQVHIIGNKKRKLFRIFIIRVF